MGGAGLEKGRGSLRPGPGAALALSGRRRRLLLPALRRASPLGAAGPEHRLPGTGGSLEASVGWGTGFGAVRAILPGTRSLAGVHCPTGIPAAEARQSLRRLRAPDPLGSRIGFPPGHFGPGPVAPRVGSWGTQDDSAACRAPSGRACQGPFSLSSPPPAPLVQRRCLGYEFEKELCGKTENEFLLEK